MKYKGFIIFIGLILSLTCCAEKVYQEGVFYLNNGDSIKCSIRVYSDDVLIGIGKLQYIKDGVEKKIPFKKIDSVRLGTYFYTFIKIEVVEYDEFDDEQITIYKKFVRVEIRGKSNLYKEFILKPDETYAFTNLNGVRGPYIYTNGYKSAGTKLSWVPYIEKKGQITSLHKMTFKKDCMRIYENCPLVVNKLKEKVFVYGFVRDLVIYANQVCNDN